MDIYECFENYNVIFIVKDLVFSYISFKSN